MIYSSQKTLYEHRCLEEYDKYTPQDFNYIKKNYSIKNLDITLEKNIKNNNFNFICTYGLGYTILGYSWENEYVKKYGIDGCICLSDVTKSKEYEQMLMTLGEFATKYNTKLMEYLLNK